MNNPAVFDPEEKIMCPYNKAHHIMRSRMNTHLVKCKKNYPDAKLVECEFNKTHHVPEPELQYHHQNCPDRKKIEINVYQEEGAVEDLFPVTNLDVPPDEECWDDCDVPSYNPQIHCERSGVLRRLDVAPAAERRNFRFDERRRLMPSTGSAGSSNVDNQRADENDEHADRRTLPPTPEGAGLQENVPSNVAELFKRVDLGKNKVIIPNRD